MKSRRLSLILALFALLILSGSLSGCDEVTDATSGTKGTAKMQNRRQQRNSEALTLGDDDKKKP